MATKLKDLNTRIAEIEAKAKPLRDELIEASLVLEAHRNEYFAIKDKLLPQIRAIEGEPGREGLLFQLIRERNALLQAGARE